MKKNYYNILSEKSNILRDNKGKAGVYKLINNVTNESYIGSSKNLYNRFLDYFNPKFLQRKSLESKSLIYKALLNYGHESFDLEILEHCNEKSKLRSREQYYMSLLNPEYNLRKAMNI
jgi:group I intron endonuclease